MSKQPDDKNNLTPPLLIIAGNQAYPVRDMPGKVRLKIHHGLLVVTARAARALKVPIAAYLPYYQHDGNVCIGPVVGILTTALRAGTGLPAGKKERIFREIITAGQHRGVFVYLFSYKNTHRRPGTVTGVTLDSKGHWVQGQYPRPDIVYNRIRTRKVENLSSIQTLLTEFNCDPSIHLFNTRFLNKWEVYQAVSGTSPISCLFPITTPFNRHNLEIMLKQSQDIFMKPENGSLGKGIIKICQTANKYQFAESSRPDTWNKCRTIDELYQSLLVKTDGELYVLQEAVRLCKIKGRVFDLRAQFQKDGQGKWVVTGAAIRIAGKNRFVTHIPNGGRAGIYHQVVSKVFANPATQISLDEQLGYICEAIPSALERTLDLQLAVLSMDIAIDTNGKMWILEVNSKPSSFDEPDIRGRHVKLFLDYCIYIARLRKKQINRKDFI